MDLIKDIMKIDNRVRFNNYQNFLETEIIIPDVKDDVVEVIKTEGFISIKKEDIMNGKIMLRGELNYNIFYIGEDNQAGEDEKNISSLSGKYEINEVIERDNIDAGMKSILKGDIEDISVDILNERKIKLNAVINISGSLFSMQKQDIIKDIAGLEDVQAYRKTIEYEDIIGIESAEIFLKESIKLDSENGVQDILSLNPYVKIKDARVSENKVVVGGVVNLHPVTLNDSNQVEKLKDENIEFTQFIEIPGAIDGMRQESYINFQDLSYSLKEDSVDSRLILEIECTIKTKSKVSECVSKEILQDAYSPYRLLKLDNKNIVFDRALAYGEEVFSIKENIQLDRGDERAKDIISVTPKIFLIDNMILEGESVIEGVINLDIAYTTTEPLKPIYIVNEEIPFKQSIDIMTQKQNVKSYVVLDLDLLDFDLSRGELEAHIKLRANYEILEEIKTSTLVSAEIEENVDISNRPSITIYIAQQGDTLWDVAKRYSATLEEIAQTNDIEESDSLKEGQCLIIEKKILADI